MFNKHELMPQKPITSADLQLLSHSFTGTMCESVMPVFISLALMNFDFLTDFLTAPGLTPWIPRTVYRYF